MIAFSRKTITRLAALLALTFLVSACPQRANDAPDLGKSEAELQEQTDNVSRKARQAIDQAESALKQSAEKIDESLESAGASN